MKQPMHKQQDPLNLGSLPQIAPPNDLWPAIESGLQRRNRKRAIAFGAGGGLAVAAAVVLAFALVLGEKPGGPAVQPAQQVSTAAAEQAVPDKGPAASATAGRLDELIALSQRLERRLRHIRTEVGDLPARAVVYQIELEDLVVQVDEELSRSPDSVALWSQRVDLLVDLERLYASGLRREYHRMASL
jgi:hypothetical protein